MKAQVDVGDADERSNDQEGNKEGVGVDSLMAAMGAIMMCDSDDNNELDEDNDTGGVTTMLDEHTLPRIKRNDPNITALTVDWEEGEFSPGFDWEKCNNEGCWKIGNNTHVKKMSIIGCYFDVVDDDDDAKDEVWARKNFKAFWEGLAGNRSIEHLQIDDCDLSSGALFSTLDPFFKENSNLRRLDVSSCILDAEGTLDLSSALEGGCDNNNNNNNNNNSSSLERIELDCNDIDDESAGELIAALNPHHHCNLVKLSLVGNNIGKNACDALGDLLRNPKCRLKELYLNRNSIDDGCVSVLVDALVENSVLEKLDLSSNSSITAAGWQALSTFDGKVKVVGAKH